MTDDEQSKIVNKIRAILRKAEEGSGATEEEADTALRMANKLLFQYGLEMADVGDLNSDRGREFEKDRVFATDSDLDQWKGTLLNRISQNYFCKVYYTQAYGRGRNWYIVGRKDYVQATLAMFEFVRPQIDSDLTVALSRMAQTHRYARKYAESIYKAETGTPIDESTTDADLARVAHERFERIKSEQGGDVALEDVQIICEVAPSYAAEIRAKVRKEQIAPAFVSNVGVWRRSFTDAASARISNRLREMMREEQTTAGSAGKALVKNEAASLAAFMDEINLNLETSNSSRRHDYNGANAGDRSGRNADLSGHSKLRGQGGALGSGS